MTVSARLSNTGNLLVNSNQNIIFDEVFQNGISFSQRAVYANWLDEIVANYITTSGGGGGGTPVVTAFTSPGSGTWTVPSDWTSTNAFYCVGAGGGGASAVVASTAHYAGGGGPCGSGPGWGRCSTSW